MPESQLDALVVGTGFSGIFQLHSLLKLGLKCRAIDTAGDLGGAWYWNRYPGAMSDSPSVVYRYSHDKEELRTYPWPNNYVMQHEILAYLNHFATKHGLREHMQFQTELISAEWDEGTKRWLARCSNGQVFVVRYLITALGQLCKKNVPDIPGVNRQDLRVKVVHSSSWDPNLDVRGKRVGVIGNGSSGVQIVSAIAETVGELHCFIRHPQYTVPAGFRAVSPRERQEINDNYDKIWDECWRSATGFGFLEASTPTMSVTPEERENIFESLWQEGNAFHFLFGAFGDIFTNEEANEEVCKFLRKKIAQTVQDPDKAAVLTPREGYTRRPLCDTGYYSRFNQENVHAIDLQKTPITFIEENGVLTADGKLHELDILVLATGFHAVDGSFKAIRGGIRGRNGVYLSDRWEHQPKSYLSLFVSGFPNLFILGGPMGPFSNALPGVMVEAKFLNELLQDMEDGRKHSTVEALPEAEARWVEMCNEMAAHFLVWKTPSWITGTNVPGVEPSARFYFGGIKGFIQELEQVKAGGYSGLEFDRGLETSIGCVKSSSTAQPAQVV